MMKPLISVLLPAYNAEPYVELAVESILGQTYRNFELIIVDDGSTDNTPTILSRFASEPRVKLLARDRQGLVPSLNEMLEISQGELVARMDADDIAEPDRFERQVDHLSINNELWALGSFVTWIDQEGCPIAPVGKYTDHDDIMRALLSKQVVHLYHPTMIFRRVCFEECGNYDAEWFPVEDVELFLRIAERGRFGNLPAPLLRYRQHSTKVSALNREEQNRMFGRLVSEWKHQYPQYFDEERESITQRPASVNRVWAWMALGAGNKKTAWKYLKRACFETPMDLGNLGLAACYVKSLLKTS